MQLLGTTLQQLYQLHLISRFSVIDGIIDFFVLQIDMVTELFYRYELVGFLPQFLFNLFYYFACKAFTFSGDHLYIFGIDAKSLHGVCWVLTFWIDFTRFCLVKAICFSLSNCLASNTQNYSSSNGMCLFFQTLIIRNNNRACSILSSLYFYIL